MRRSFLQNLIAPQCTRATSRSIVGRKDPQPGDDLRAAAKKVEDTAFDLAGGCDAVLISQLIVIAADLERIAGVLDHAPPKGVTP